MTPDVKPEAPHYMTLNEKGEVPHYVALDDKSEAPHYTVLTTHHSLPLTWTQIFSSHLFLKTLNPSLMVRDQVSHPYTI
jgi:hypothetical protein